MTFNNAHRSEKYGTYFFLLTLEEILVKEGNLPVVETGRLRGPLVRAKSPERGSVQYLLAASKLDTLKDISRQE